MYNVIKEDQQKRGRLLKDEDISPTIALRVSMYECVIGLTNDGEIHKSYQKTEYKFPVINLTHGKECYDYLAKKLQDKNDDFDVIGSHWNI